MAISGENKLQLSDFRLAKVTLELRYQNAYMLWDKSGSIWTDIQKKFRTIDAIKADPNTTLFRIDSNYDVSINIDRINITVVSPENDLSDLMDVAKSILEVVPERLTIKRFERIGLRLYYNKNFDSIEDASAAIASSNILSIPKTEIFSLKVPIVHPEYTIRMDGENTGVRAKVSALTKKINIDISREVQDVESVNKEWYIVELDIDYYARLPILIGQLNVYDWIKQALHLVRRDSAVFLRAS